MLERLPYFRFHAADYLLDTAGLTFEEHGAYLLLLINYYWAGSLPASRPELFALLRAGPKQQPVIERMIARYFHEEDGRIVHHRVDRELAKLGAFFGSQRANAAASVAARSAPEKRAKPNGKAHPEPLTLPDWLDSATWASWIKIRPAKARTVDAQRAALAKLESMRSAGHDANAIIRNSLANGWQGIFTPDHPPENAPRKVAL